MNDIPMDKPKYTRSNKDIVRREIKEWEISDTNDLDAFDEFLDKPVLGYECLVQIIEKDKSFGVIDDKKIIEFISVEDHIDRLALLQKMSLAECMLVAEYFTPEGVAFMKKRYERYKALLNNDDKYYNHFVGIATGIVRDIAYASMINTPEIAIYRRASSLAEDLGFSDEFDTTAGLRGGTSRFLWTQYASGDESHASLSEQSFVGTGNFYAYAQLYKDIKKELLKEGVEESKVENEVVKKCVQIILDACEYNDPYRPFGSSYRSQMKEAVDWAQLNEPVRQRFRGMRMKIEGVSLRNIGRFIGKTPDKSWGFRTERKKLEFDIKILEDENKTESEKLKILKHYNNLETQNAEKELYKALNRAQLLYHNEVSALDQDENLTDDIQSEKMKAQNAFEDRKKRAQKEYRSKIAHILYRNDPTQEIDLRNATEQLIKDSARDKVKMIAYEARKKIRKAHEHRKNLIHNAQQADNEKLKQEQIDEQIEQRIQKILQWRDNSIKKVNDDIEKLLEREQEIVSERTPRNIKQLTEDLKKKRDETKFKEQSHYNLAEKAIQLTFALNNSAYVVDGNLDWINEIPFGLINRAHKMLLKGVSLELINGYTKATLHFPDLRLSQSQMLQFNTMTRWHLEEIRFILDKFITNKTEINLDKLIRLANHSISNKDVVDMKIDEGYSIDQLLDHIWLVDSGISTENGIFPEDGPKQRAKQERWCVNNAYYVPEAWNHARLGNIILNRLEAGIDANVHDATYWLSEFEVPDERNGVVYKNLDSELQFLHSVIFAPAELKAKLPKKKRKYAELFSKDATELIYEAIISLTTNNTFDFEHINNLCLEKLSEYKQNPRMARSLKVDLDTLETQLHDALQELEAKVASGSMPQHTDGSQKHFPEWIADLKVVGKNRREFIDTAQTWVSAHASTPRSILTIAWANREMALKDGCADNPRAIKQWADLNTLRSSYDAMVNNGTVPDGFERQDLMKFSNWLQELVRCYDGKTAIRVVAEMKKSYNADYYIPPMKIDLDEGWHGEVLEKQDPRGFTIGHDTGCCMTVNGVSRSCIRAGYTQPSYGFFALYKDGQLVAQSFLYTNMKKNPDILVCDNIEANQGRDLEKVAKKYEKFFHRYITTQLRRDETVEFSKVHIGTGYSAVGLHQYQETFAVPMEDASIYTDARNQRTLLQLPDSEVALAKSIKADYFKGDWEDIVDDILNIEKDAFLSQGWKEKELQKLFSEPENIKVLLRKDDKIIGYVVAEPKEHDTLYVSSTAIAHKYQRQGLVAELMYLLDTEAVRRGYQYYERDARVEGGYADKLKKNYEVIEEGGIKESIYGAQKYLKLAIPQHPKNKRMEEVEKIKHAKPTLEFQTCGLEQARIVDELEKTIYPKEMQLGMLNMMEEIGEIDDAKNVSFLVNEEADSKKIPMGYVIAYMTDAEYDSSEDEVLYIADFALMPGHQRHGYGKKMFERIVKIASGYDGAPIEFHARETTSYPALMHSIKSLYDLGYRIVLDIGKDEDEDLIDYFETGNHDAESVRFIRLERAEKKKIAA